MAAWPVPLPRLPCEQGRALVNTHDVMGCDGHSVYGGVGVGVNVGWE
jgi:hypothetical protein